MNYHNDLVIRKGLTQLFHTCHIVALRQEGLKPQI